MSALRRLMRDDQGTALFTVVMMSMIMFILVTGLLVLQQHYVNQVRTRSQRVSATHVADAGLNDYLVHLKADPDYYKKLEGTWDQWVDFEGGQYTVVPIPPQNGNPLTLHVTGKTDHEVRIDATVRYPTFADYLFLANGDIQFYSGDVVNGEVRSNSNIFNSGHITGEAYAAGSIDASGGGLFDQGKYPGYAKAPFEKVTKSKDDVKEAALANGSYFDAVAIGYKVTFNGTSYTVAEITGDISTGNLMPVNPRTFTIPGNGAVYFDSNVWLSGNYGANVTVACGNNIYLIDSYQRTSETGRYSSGLIATQNIIIPSMFESVPHSMLVNAALVTEKGAFYADMQTGQVKHRLTLLGSVAFWDASGQMLTRDTNGSCIAGFREYSRNYDQLLEVKPPPFYPFTGDSAIKVATWIEGSGINQQ